MTLAERYIDYTKKLSVNLLRQEKLRQEEGKLREILNGIAIAQYRALKGKEPK